MAWKKGFSRGYKKSYKSYGNKVKAPFFRMLNTEPRVSTIHVAGGAYHKKNGDIVLNAEKLGEGLVAVHKNDKNYGQALKAIRFMKNSKNYEKKEDNYASDDPTTVYDEKK